MYGTDIQSLLSDIRERTENFYGAHRLCCSEAIMLVINRGLGGGLSDETALQIATGFCGGMGGEEGACGALTGAMAALGLFLGPNRPQGLSKKQMRAAARSLHDAFKEKFFSTYCSDLTAEFKSHKSARLKNCQRITGIGAELTVKIILEHRPDLANNADHEFLSKRDSKAKALLGKFSAILK